MVLDFLDCFGKKKLCLIIEEIWYENMAVAGLHEFTDLFNCGMFARKLKCMGTSQSFSTMFSKGDNFCDFLFTELEDEVFPKLGPTLKGKNLLLWEQILSLVS